MPESPAIAVFVLLALPGLLALWLYQTLAPTKPLEISAQVVVAVVLSTLSYLVVGLLHVCASWVPDPAVLLNASGEDLSSVFAPRPLLVVVAACAVSTLIGLLMVIQTCHECLHRACRAVRITRRFGYASHWDAVTHTKAKGSWIGVKFKDGTAFYGAMESHSDSSEERSLLLSNVTKLASDGKEGEKWECNEYLFIPDISEVRSMRIHTSRKEPSVAKKDKRKPSKPVQPT